MHSDKSAMAKTDQNWPAEQTTPCYSARDPINPETGNDQLCEVTHTRTAAIVTGALNPLFTAASHYRVRPRTLMDAAFMSECSKKLCPMLTPSAKHSTLSLTKPLSHEALISQKLCLLVTPSAKHSTPPYVPPISKFSQKLCLPLSPSAKHSILSHKP